MARLRGEHQEPWSRWRYIPVRPSLEPPQSAVAVEVYDEALVAEEPDDEPAPAPHRWAAGRFARTLAVAWICLRLARTLTRWALVLAVVSVGYVAVSWVVHQLTPRPASLPATPRAWLTAYEGAAVDNPGEVCSQLLSPQLAAIYARRAHSSCRAWFGRITASSVAVRHVLVQSGTAVLELRQTLTHQNWSVVLDHQAGGWLAVDILAS
jgi:hypothetical protein